MLKIIGLTAGLAAKPDSSFNLVPRTFSFSENEKTQGRGCFYLNRGHRAASKDTFFFSIITSKTHNNRPFPSSPGPLYQNEVKCSAFDMEIIFHPHEGKTHFHKKGCALRLILKVRLFGIRKWPIVH